MLSRPKLVRSVLRCLHADAHMLCDQAHLTGCTYRIAYI